jgi:hypothetical protein
MQRKEILKREFLKLKPTKSFWGIGSVILLFIIPDIISFIWGTEIKEFFDERALNSFMSQEQYLYSKLGEILSEGSWINILIGVAILIWAFF